MSHSAGEVDIINRLLQTKLNEILRRTPWFHRALVAVQNLGGFSAHIGAGAIRNAVWDSLEGYASPSVLPDIDVVYFDSNADSAAAEHSMQVQLARECPDLPWEVTNQATVHRWFEGYFGYRVAPLKSVEDAVRTWPETATCVAVRLDDRDRMDFIAPFGLDDLFAMKIRWNPTRITREGFLERVQQKDYRRRWPNVEIILTDGSESRLPTDGNEQLNLVAPVDGPRIGHLS